MQIFKPVWPGWLVMSEQFGRRASDALSDSDLRTDAYAAMGEVSDPGYRAVLGLMIRVLDTLEAKTDRMYQALNGKLDTILKDERNLKNMVLNGHSEVHDAHHRWIDERIKHDGHCAWATMKIEEEKVKAQDRRGLKNALVEKVVIALIAGGVGLFAPHLLALLK